MKNKTLVLGATSNPSRYAFRAVERLLAHGHEVQPLGIREGKVGGLEILQGQPLLEEIDTVSLYIRAEHQKAYYDYLLQLKPRRIIFNPGTENPELMQLAKRAGIENIVGCTLVMLSTNSY